MSGDPRGPDDRSGGAVLVWNGSIARVPALVVRPGSVAEILAAVEYALDHGLSLRIRPVADEGAAGAPAYERTVTIDLTGMRSRAFPS